MWISRFLWKIRHLNFSALLLRLRAFKVVISLEDGDYRQSDRGSGWGWKAGVAGGLLGWLTSLSPPLSRQFMASSGLAAMGTAALVSQWSS